MEEVFKNIKEKIKNQPIEQFVGTNGDWDLVQTVLDCCCEAVDRVKEEYNNGWIPCSERLPDKSGEYLTYVDYEDETFIAIDEIDCDGIMKEWNCTPNYHVIAWQPLPEPYQPKGE